MSGPEIAVVIPTYMRPLRLRWLLNALEEQTLDRRRFEVLVACDADDEETAELLLRHPLADAGVLRRVISPSPAAAVKRNAGWQAARAPLIAFTDDDCRPPEQWLEQALTAAGNHSGAVIQGSTRPDPAEVLVWDSSPWATSQTIEPPHPSGQTCNVIYPRELLERVDGFDEAEPMGVGEDTDLLERVRKTGAAYVGVAEVLTYHAVEDRTLLGRLRWIVRWQELPELFGRHPRLRRYVPLGVFWKWTHPTLLLAVAGTALAATRRDPRWALLVLPWAKATWPFHGRHRRGVARSLVELPGRAAIDAMEIAVLVRGSLRHRSLFL